MTRSGLGERPFEQCPVMAGLVAKVGDRAAVASQLTQTRHAAPSRFRRNYHWFCGSPADCEKTALKRQNEAAVRAMILWDTLHVQRGA